MATTRPRPWNYSSVVEQCQLCEGHGEVCNTPRHTHPNDPDRCNIDCPDCDGVGQFACSVCGFDEMIAGYDCLVCQIAADIPLKLANLAMAKQFADAMAAAFEVMQEHALAAVDREAA